LTVLLATAVPAMLIVDTGVPTAGPGGALFGWQWFYGQFTTSQDYIVTDVFGYIDGATYDGYPVKLTLSSDSSGGLGTTLFSQDFIPPYGPGWQGVSGVSWNLAAGTYWVGFEVHNPESYFSGNMVSDPPQPLDKCGMWYRTIYEPNFTWTEYYTGGIGLQIYGDPVSSAPLPGGIPLLGSGLAILWLWRKKCSA
jgi:hypothetical protein